MVDKEKLSDSILELNTKLRDSQDSLQNLVFQKSMQQLEDLYQINKTKKTASRSESSFFLEEQFRCSYIWAY